jgi:hypothetical protein
MASITKIPGFIADDRTDFAFANANITGNLTSANANLGNTATANYFAGVLTTAAQPNITSVGTLSSLTVTANISAGGVKTDNLYYANGNPFTFVAQPAGANTQVQFNNNGFTGASGNLTFNTTTNTLTVDNISANGFSLSSLQGSNVTGAVANATYAINAGTAGVANSVAGSNVSGQVSNASIAGTVYTASQPNITSVGTLTGLTVTANILADGVKTDHLYYSNGTPYTFSIAPAGSNTQVQFNNDGVAGASGNLTFNTTTKTLTVDNITANGSGLSSLQGSNVSGAVANATYAVNAGTAGVANSVAGANVSGQVSNASIAGTVYTASQPNITSVGTLTSLTVTANILVDGVKTDNLYHTDGTPYVFVAAPAGSNTQVQFNNDGVTGASANLTFNTTTKTLTVDNITANGNGLSSLYGPNVTGQVANAIISGTVYTAAQPNITSVGTLLDTTMGSSNSLSGGNLVSATYLTGTLTTASQPNITSVGTLTSVTSSGNINAGTNYILANNIGDDNTILRGNASLLTGVKTKANITSSITSIVAGSTVSVSTDYTDPLYPAGKFVISQLGPVSLTLTDVWSTTTSTSKNAYANYLASSINTSNISITLSLANASFAVTSTDSITIGGSTVTGTNLTSLGITGTGGTYTIPNTSFSSTVQTTSTSAVTTSLTTDRGVYAATGTSLTTAQPVAYTVNSITGSFPASTVPYWSLNQTFSWSVSITGTTSSGNLTYSGGSISTTSLSSAGGASGTSGSIDSTSSYTITTSDYVGAGLNGYGTRTIPSTVNGTVSAATKYYPLFWKTTSSSSVPTFTTSDSRNSNNYATGQGATTSTTSTNYLWLAIPNYPSNSGTLASHAFKHVFGGFDIVDTPAVTGTQTITTSGQSYNYSIYGFTGFTQASIILTTS